MIQGCGTVSQRKHFSWTPEELDVISAQTAEKISYAYMRSKVVEVEV